MDEQYLESLTEEELDELVRLGQIPQQVADLQRQRRLAEELRYDKGRDPQGINTGRTFVAANPLEFVGRGLEQYGAQKKMGDLDKQLGDLGIQQAQGRKSYWDLLRGKGKGRVKLTSVGDLPDIESGVEDIEMPNYEF